MKRITIIFSLMVFMAVSACFLVTFLKPKPVHKKSIQKELEKPPRQSFALLNAAYEFMMTRDPKTNTIPGDIRRKEREFLSGFTRKASPGNQVWKWRGPANIGGRMLCLAFDVDDENKILAGSASGGMWKSVNQGLYWAKVTAPDVEQSATCIAQDVRPGKHQTWYYGTGELLSTTDRNISTNVRTIGMGNGIFKSIDSGETWVPLESTTGGGPGSLDNVFQGVWNIVIDPVTTNKDILYAACYGAIMRSEDGGVSWQVTLGDIENKSFSTDVTLTSQGVLYAALSTYSWSIMHPQKAGIWRSVDGINWTNITPVNFPEKTRVMKLCVAPSNENILYLVTETPSSLLKPFDGIFNSDISFWKYTFQGGNNPGVWEDRTQNIPGHGDGNFPDYPYSFMVYGGYTMTLKVKPDDENVVFLAGMNLYRSVNGFSDSLSTHCIGGDGYDMDSLHQLHPDQHSLSFLPSDPNVLFLANDGGMYRIDNCLTNSPYWQRLNSRLGTTQFFTVCVDPASSGNNFILGGLQDNNWYYSPTDDAGELWNDVDICYDGFAAAIANKHDYCVVSAYSGNIWTSLFDDQMLPKNIYFQLPDTLLKQYDSVMGSNELFPFYQNFALDPNNNETFYLPTKTSIWRKSDLKSAAHDPTLRNVGWENLSLVDVGDDAQISAITVSTNPANRLYYGTNLGRVYRVDQANSGNPSPVEITGLHFPFNAFVACIDVNPENADQIMVIFSNYHVQSLFYTSDGGTTWTAEGGNLEEFPDGSGSGPSVRWVKQLNTSDGTVFFAGTSAGLYSTVKLKDDSTEWVQEGPASIGTVIVAGIDARQSDGFIAVGTQGNGVYSTYYKSTSFIGNYDDSNIVALLNTFPNPSTGKVTITFRILHQGEVTVKLYNCQGKEMKTLLKTNLREGQFSGTYDLSSLSPGIFFIILKAGNSTKSNKVILM